MTTASKPTFRLPAALVLVSLACTLAWACASRAAFKPCNVVTSEPKPEPGAADTTDGEPAADSTG